MARSLSTDDLTGRQEPAPTARDDAPATPYPDDDAASSGPATDSTDTRDEGYAPLLDDRESDAFLERWSEVQSRFVDDPQGAVRDGDGLVAELMQSLAQRFSDHKAGLEQQWGSGGEPDTEELRRALQQYRSFFHRLLST